MQICERFCSKAYEIVSSMITFIDCSLLTGIETQQWGYIFIQSLEIIYTHVLSIQIWRNTSRNLLSTIQRHILARKSSKANVGHDSVLQVFLIKVAKVQICQHPGIQKYVSDSITSNTGAHQGHCFCLLYAHRMQFEQTTIMHKSTLPRMLLCWVWLKSNDDTLYLKADYSFYELM